MRVKPQPTSLVVPSEGGLIPSPLRGEGEDEGETPRRSREGGNLASPANRKPLLLLMDGHAMVYRAWFALQQTRPFTIRATGEDVRGVYSFTTTFFKTLADHKPTHAAIAFDLPRPHLPP